MKKLIVVALGIFALTLLAGCSGSGGGLSWLGSTGETIFAGGGGSGSDGGNDGGGGSSALGHSPEPATIALMGGGLAVLAFLSRRKRK